MINSLSLKRFKSWQDIPRMRFAPITGLFGTNSSGKSSLMHFLLMLKQTAESTDRSQVFNYGDDSSHISLGTYRDVVFAHKPETSIFWQVHWSLPSRISVADPERKRAHLFSDDSLIFTGEVIEDKSARVRVKQFSYRFADIEFGMRQGDKPEKYDLFPIKKGKFQFRRAPGRPWDLPAPTKNYGFPDQVRAYYQNAGFLGDFELALEELFSKVFYLGPLRQFPEREYAWSGGQPADMGRRGENAVAAILASREQGTKISRGRGIPRLTLEEYVAHWLERLGLIDSFHVDPIAKESNLYRVLVKKGARSPAVLITEVGFGVSQILPVLVICYYVPEGSTIMLEHPEIHLHPSAQSGLADVFIDAYRNRHIQIILESHSEHLLRRLQRRIAEGELSPEQAALYFCDVDGGESRLTKLDVDLWGNITNWPKDFFGDQFEEIAAMAEAGIRRRVKEAG